MTTQTGPGSTWAPPQIPAPAPQAPYTPLKKKSSTGKKVLLAVAILMGLGLVIDVVSNQTNDGTKGGRGGGTGARTETDSPTADLNGDERSLYRSAPYYDVAPIPRGSLIQGAVAGITADATKGKNGVEQRVNYYKFKDNSTMAASFADRLAVLRNSAAVDVVDVRGWCLTTMSLPCYASDGRALFYKKGGSVHTEWTYFPKKTYSTAVRRDTNMAKLQALWRGAGPE